MDYLTTYMSYMFVIAPAYSINTTRVFSDGRYVTTGYVYLHNNKISDDLFDFDDMFTI